MAFRAQAKANREALKAAASAPNPDPAAVGAAFLKVKANGQAAKAKMKAVRTEIDAVLTPEQRAKLDGWIAAHRQQRAHVPRRAAAELNWNAPAQATGATKSNFVTSTRPLSVSFSSGMTGSARNASVMKG